MRPLADTGPAREPAYLRPGAAEALLAAAAVASVAIGFLSGSRFVLPLAAAALAYPFFLADVRARKGRRALARMLVWALAMSVVTVAGTLAGPDRAAASILRGEEYRDEMFRWIETGDGAEGDPSRFLPEHALHFAIFCVLSVASAGFLALAFGAVLLDYMNFYVAELLQRLDPLFPGALVAWPLYAMVRVAGFVSVAVALTHLSLALRARRAPDRGFFFRWFYAGLALVAGDALLKIVLAPIGRDVLSGALPA